jgi:hypothetical protein
MSGSHPECEGPFDRKSECCEKGPKNDAEWVELARKKNYDAPTF